MDLGVAAFQRQAATAQSTVASLTSLSAQLPSAVVSLGSAQGVLAGVLAEQSNLASTLNALVAGAVNASTCAALRDSATRSRPAQDAAVKFASAPLAAVEGVSSAVAQVLAIFTTAPGDQFCAPCATAAVSALANQAAACAAVLSELNLVMIAGPALTSLLDGVIAAANATSAVRASLSSSAASLTRVLPVGASTLSGDDVMRIVHITNALGSAGIATDDMSVRVDAMIVKVASVKAASTTAVSCLQALAPSDSNAVYLLQSTMQSVVGFGEAVSSILTSQELGSFLTLVDVGAGAVFDVIMDGVGLLKSLLLKVDEGLNAAS